MTEKLFTGTLNHNQNKQKLFFRLFDLIFRCVFYAGAHYTRRNTVVYCYLAVCILFCYFFYFFTATACNDLSFSHLVVLFVVFLSVWLR